MEIIEQGKLMEWAGKEVSCSCGCKFKVEKKDEVEVHFVKTLRDEYDYSELDSGYLGRYISVDKHILARCPNCREKVLIHEEFVVKGLSKEQAAKYPD